MAVIQNGDIVLARMVCYDGDQVGQMDMHYIAGPPLLLGSTFSQVAGALDAIVAPLIKALLSSAVTYRGVGVRRVFPLATKTTEFQTIVSAGAGGAGAIPCPQQVSGLIQKTSYLPGRHGRGRLYVPFPATASVIAGGLPLAAYITALGNLSAALGVLFTAGTLGNTNTFTPILWQKPTGPATLLVGCQPGPFFATQRRRGNYGRRNPVPF
jgi:hypothetical protein